MSGKGILAGAHPRLSVSAISSYGWSLEQDLAWWAETGLAHVGVSVAKLEAAGWDGAVRAVADAGVRVGNVIGPGPFRLKEEAGWPGERERMRAVLAAAGALEAGCVVLTTGPAGGLSWEEAAQALGRAAGPVLEDHHGPPVCFEHTNSLRPDIGFLQSLADAVFLARELGAGVCMECNACWLERGLQQTISSSMDVIRLVQVSDFVVGTRDTPNRAVPGDGDIPLRRILGQVLESGYEGDFDLEIIGPRIEAEGYEAAISRSLDRLGELLASLGA